ncbi:PfkB family carbohydrate kinase [Kitasatospora sp. NPDC058048]|uniref:PfkB family carbohydrate kinase n=1 Tax=Kitasatospora sp. NPDC058048 TaxID=3346313 RepID=UPI0036DEBE8A
MGTAGQPTDAPPPRGLFVGLCTLDVVHLVARRPDPDEKVSAEDQVVAAGGPATNAAVAFAHLGGAATLVSAIGGHGLAGIMRDDLTENGVRIVDIAVDQTRPPRVSAVAVTKGTGARAVIAYDTAPPGIAPTAAVTALARRAEIVEVDGHYPEAALAALRAARAEHRLTVYDGGRWRPEIRQLLQWVEVAVCSADFRPPGCSTPADVLAFLAERGVRYAALTSGKGAVDWRGPNGAAGRVEVPGVDVVDTLGAGDVFHGALSYGLAQAEVLDPDVFESAIGFAVDVASRSCTAFGTRAWMTDTAEPSK